MSESTDYNDAIGAANSLRAHVRKCQQCSFVVSVQQDTDFDQTTISLRYYSKHKPRLCSDGRKCLKSVFNVRKDRDEKEEADS